MTAGWVVVESAASRHKQQRGGTGRQYRHGREAAVTAWASAGAVARPPRCMDTRRALAGRRECSFQAIAKAEA